MRRFELNRSQQDVAGRAGIDRQTVIRLEHGHNYPSFTKLDKIRTGLDWTWTDLGLALDDWLQHAKEGEAL